MNYRYLNNLNIKSIRMKNPFNCGKPKVIQIGVGGATASGKTVLIDAIFAVLDNQNYPVYLPPIDKFSIDGSKDIFNGRYKDYVRIRKDVSKYFHDPYTLKTPPEEGKFDSNTYRINFKSNGKKCILIIRNLPGEMFSQYFSDETFDVLKKKSLNEKFDDFVSKHDDYKENKYKYFFVSPNKNSEQEIKQFKSAFIKYLIVNYPLPNPNNEMDKENHTILENNPKFNIAMDDFYAFVFYKSSDTIIKCFRANDMTDPQIIEMMKKIKEKENEKKEMEKAGKELVELTEEIEKMKQEIAQSDEEVKINIDMRSAPQIVLNEYICITQFDRALKSKDKISYFKFANINEKEEKWKDYAEKMSELYTDITTEKFEKIEKEKLLSGTPDNLNHLYPYYYISSVAFNCDADNFWDFISDKSKISKWSLRQNKYRTSLGVVELVSNILNRNDIKLSLHTSCLNEEKYTEFRKRL